MPSPFPGVDPFVELSGRWTGLHHILIAHCSEFLNAELSQKYVAVVDERPEPNQPYIDIISLALREPLPVLGIPTESVTRDVALNLGAVFKMTYDRGRYDRSLRYYLPLPQGLAESDREWARARGQTMLQ